MLSRLSPEALQSKVRELPALPQVLTDLLLALQRDDVALEQLALKVANDQSLAAKTLRLANCSFYGVAGRVSSIRDAINILGLRNLTGALTAAAVSGCFERPSCEGFDFDAYWRHSIATASCAQVLAKPARLDEGTAFTAGLLHDIGRLALASHFPLEMAAAIAHRDRDDCPMLEAEQAVLGTDHTIVGAMLAEHWKFAPPIVETIRHHHAPPAQAVPTLVDAVHVADNIAHALDLARTPAEIVPPLSLAAWKRLALPPEQYLKTFERTEAEVEGLCDALAL